MATKKQPIPTSLRELIAHPKGEIDHLEGEAFLLHVFWLAPSHAAAQKLLAGLKQCAAATARDTPCVPTYFFRIANNDKALCPPPPRTAGDHPQLSAARKKLQVGIPRPALSAELVKRGIDPSLVDLELTAELPAELQQQPVAVEFTEVYLDERAFVVHAGSRDYLDGYGVVMNLSLHYTIPTTIRLGTPCANIIEKILEPILHEQVLPLQTGCSVWQRPLASSSSSSATSTAASFLSIDFDISEAEPDAEAACAALASKLPSDMKQFCTTCVVFVHPLRPRTIRVMCVVPSMPSQSVLTALATLQPARGEAHTSEETAETLRAALADVGLSEITVNATECVGHVLCEKAAELHVASASE